jgi:phosphoribosylformylglycinamidine cyclo-ligase
MCSLPRSVQAGNISEPEMFRTFNMGIGMVIVVRPEDADAVQQLESSAIVLGRVVQGEGVHF